MKVAINKPATKNSRCKTNVAFANCAPMRKNERHQRFDVSDEQADQLVILFIGERACQV